ncbi:MAG TPA: helix-turn-helix domain-containing protein [Burkholderiaceae bacterium]|nr:helix-turn-helix domain-containing protein [Burkholderiaceae bacterium]
MSSLEKGLRALALLSPDRPRLRVSEVAEALGVPKSSASRLLATLDRHGFLERGARHAGFECGFELQRLGRMYRSGDAVTGMADEALRDLVARHPATGYLACLDGLETIILRVRESPTPVRFVVSEGTRLPAFVTAIGKALLSRLDSQQLLTLLPERLTHRPLSVSMTRAALLRELGESRERGWTELVDQAGRGIGAAAVAVGAPNGRTVGIALSWMERDMTRARHRRAVAELLAAARTVGRRVRDPYWLSPEER